MRLHILTLAGLLAIFSTPGRADNSTGVAQSDVTAALKKRILAGDIDAIGEAAQSGNKEFIPVLKKVVGRREYRGSITSSPVEQARVALAKLGDPHALQTYWCGAIAEVPAVPQLASIGGWFTFHAIDRIFDGVGAAEFEKAARNPNISDIRHYYDPRKWGVEVLSELVSNPPPGVPERPIERGLVSSEWANYIRIWREWIRSHESELRTLRPTGEGVEFTAEACKNGQPRMKPR
jgi:hypothetical protein